MNKLKSKNVSEEVTNWSTPMKVVMGTQWPWPISVVSEDQEHLFAEWDSYCSTEQITPQQVLQGDGAGWSDNDKQEAFEHHQLILVNAHLFANSLDMLKVLDRLVSADEYEDELSLSIAVDEAKEILARFGDLTPEFIKLED